MDHRQRLGAVALAVGVVLIGVGTAGALSEGSTAVVTGAATTPSRSSPAPAASPTRLVTAPPTPSPTPDVDRLVRAFFVDFVRLTRAREAEAMLATLHPATIERYGEAACRAFLETRDDPTFDVAVVSVTPEPFPYTTDDLVTTIEDALTVTARVTNAGQTVDRVLHVALIEGDVRWFTDCGTPLAASPAP